MKGNGGGKLVGAAIALSGIAILAIPFLIRRPEVEPPPTEPRRDPPAAAPGSPAVAPTPPSLPGRPTPPDPLLAKWQTAIVRRDAPGVLAAQSAFLEREGEYREPLMRMAEEDPDPRIRAFSISVLARMKSPPPEQFFIDRLADAGGHPQVSALEALKKVGTSACLPAVDGLAASPAPESVRAAAAETAKAVRSR